MSRGVTSESGQRPSLRRTSAGRLLIALLVMVGTAVLGLCVVFFANKFATRIEPIMVVPVEATSANASAASQGDRQLAQTRTTPLPL